MPKLFQDAQPKSFCSPAEVEYFEVAWVFKSLLPEVSALNSDLIKTVSAGLAKKLGGIVDEFRQAGFWFELASGAKVQFGIHGRLNR